MIYLKLATLPFHIAGQALKLIPSPKIILGFASVAVIALPPVNKQVESAWHYGFEKNLTTPSIGVGKLRTPEVTVSIFHVPAAKQVVEQVVNTAAEAAGLDVNFRIGQRDEVITAIIHGAINLGITDVGQISYILATAQHESASFSTTKEIGSCDYFAFQAGGNGYANRLGNRGVSDACTYFGRGLVQLTGRNNYKRMSEKYGVDFLTNPQLVEEPGYAITIMIEGMMGGLFTGKALPQYVAGDKRDYVNARRVVNGTDRAQHIAAIARNYESLVSKTLADYGY